MHQTGSAMWVIAGVVALGSCAYASPQGTPTVVNEPAATQSSARDEASCEKKVARMALPLDHGLRADTTPWLNAQRRARALEACRAGAVARTP